MPANIFGALQQTQDGTTSPEAVEIVLSKVDLELDRLLDFFGLQATAFIPDSATSERHKCKAAKTGSFEVIGADGSRLDKFNWGGRSIQARLQSRDDGFEGGVNNIKESMTKTTFPAARLLLEDILIKQKVSEEYKIESLARFDKLQTNFETAMDNLRAIAIKQFGADFTEMSVFDKKLVPNYTSIMENTRKEMQEFLYKQERAHDELGAPLLDPRWYRNWDTSLANMEKDVLSANKRNPQVVIFEDDLRREKPGYMVEIAWPLTDISSLDRRKYDPPETQVRPNFWLQINIHFDNSGNELSRSVVYRGASHNVLEIKNRAERLEATKNVIFNELRLYAFMQIRQALVANPDTPISDLMQNLTVMQTRNMGLQSTFLKDYGYIAQTRKAFSEVMRECEQRGGLSLGQELIDELVRITQRVDLKELDAKPWLKAKIMQDNLGTNASRGANMRSKLRKSINVEPLQINIRKKANLERINDFSRKLAEVSIASPQLQQSSAFKHIAQIVMYLQKTCANNPKVDLDSEWSQVKEAYKQALQDLKQELGQPIDFASELAKQYDNLFMFGLHMEHNLKPQICPVSFKNFVFTKITDERMSFIRQCIAACLDEKMAAKLDPDKIGLGLAEIFSVNCQSGKDRTGMFLAFKEALQIVMDNEKLDGRPLELDKLDHYIDEIRAILPNIVNKTVGRNIAESNCPGAWSFLAQNRFAGVHGGLLYATEFVERLRLNAHNKIGRLNKDRWSGKKSKLGQDGEWTIMQRNRQELPPEATSRLSRTVRAFALVPSRASGSTSMHGDDDQARYISRLLKQMLQYVSPNAAQSIINKPQHKLSGISSVSSSSSRSVEAGVKSSTGLTSPHHKPKMF